MNRDEKDTIIAAWGENCAGIGWANQPIWVLIRNYQGQLRIESIQPKDQNGEMHAYHRITACAVSGLIDAIERKLRLKQEASPDGKLHDQHQALRKAVLSLLEAGIPDAHSDAEWDRWDALVAATHEALEDGEDEIGGAARGSRCQGV